MNFLRTAATKGYTFLQELDEGVPKESQEAKDEEEKDEEADDENVKARHSSSRLAGHGRADEGLQSLWSTAADFGRQLVQEIKPETETGGNETTSAVGGRTCATMEDQHEKEDTEMKEKNEEKTIMKKKEKDEEKEEEEKESGNVEKGKEKDRDREREKKKEEEKEEETEKEDGEKERENEREKETVTELERQGENEMEEKKEKDVEMEKAIARKREMELEREKEKEMEEEKEKEKQIEKDREKETEREREMELERQEENETEEKKEKEEQMEKEREKETQRERGIEFERQKEKETEQRINMEKEEEEEEKAKENQKEKEKKMEAEEEKENTKVAKAEENHKAEERELVMEVKKEIVEERKQEVAAEEDAPLDIAASRQPKAAIATSSYDEVADLKATATTAEVADAVKRADAAEEAAQVFSERIETLELARADAVDQAQQAEQKLAEVHEALKTARITEARLRRENEDMEQEMRNAQSLWREQVKAAEKRGDEAMKELKRELSEFRKHSSKIEAERDTLLGESKKAAVREKRLVEENKDMEKELYQAQDRWRQQIQLAEQRAESAQCDGKGTTQRLTEQLRATEAEKEALLAALEKSSNSEQRVREDNKDMERELYQAQERWREQIRVAERRAEEASAQCQHHMQEAEGLRKQIAEAAVEESEFRQRVEDELKTGRLDFDRRGEELRAANEIEGQLRRELALTDRARMLLDERIAELELQLERAQTAYTAAAEEIAAMQSRSDELEFGSYDKTNSEELLLRELEGFRERHTELEKRLSEVTWMRDYARTQAEEARAEAQRCREEAQRAQEEQRNSVVAANLVVAASGRDGGEESPIASSRARLDAAEARHADEQKRALALHSEELDHLRKRIEEKDRRLEILTCERNAFRLQCSEQPPPVSVVSSNRAKPKKASATGADKAGDLEEGLQLRSRLGDSEDFQSAATNCSKDVDMLLRRFSRLLFISPTTRSLFYGYLALIHIWVWVVLHHTAATRQ
eukprot:TRINITY_DN13163_c2_g1_i8.p1 TRINITY_DN13163_c2_g1~~TRINITY_DN13163_c2_g1_i8.p1  ORF type:complete len:996 (+),score=355.12 TRINITY_DN13163_c2_g1_i8:60-3047(+)